MVYIDEVDKITKKVPQFSSLFIYFYLNLFKFRCLCKTKSALKCGNLLQAESLNLSRDVSGEGVQQALLKMLEGTVSGSVLHSSVFYIFLCHQTFMTYFRMIAGCRNSTLCFPFWNM